MRDEDSDGEGCRVGQVFGTSWHGVMESDALPPGLPAAASREERGLDWVPGDESFAAARETPLRRLGDLVAENVDRDALLRLIDDGPPSGLPVVGSQLSAISHQHAASEVALRGGTLTARRRQGRGVRRACACGRCRRGAKLMADKQTAERGSYC